MSRILPVIAPAELFQPRVVEGEALAHVFAQPLRGPAAELRGDKGFYPVAKGNDHVEVIKGNFPCDPSAAFLANLSEIPTG